VLATFHESYYATAATVIPLFLFLIVFERRLLTVKLDTRMGWFSVMDVVAMPLFVVLFVVGEWSALDALRVGHASRFRELLVEATIIFQLWTIMLVGLGIVLRPALVEGGRWALRVRQKRAGPPEPPDD
jgi:hypothetical protein